MGKIIAMKKKYDDKLKQLKDKVTDCSEAIEAKIKQISSTEGESKEGRQKIAQLSIMNARLLGINDDPGLVRAKAEVTDQNSAFKSAKATEKKVADKKLGQHAAALLTHPMKYTRGMLGVKGEARKHRSALKNAIKGPWRDDKGHEHPGALEEIERCSQKCDAIMADAAKIHTEAATSKAKQADSPKSEVKASAASATTPAPKSTQEPSKEKPKVKTSALKNAAKIGKETAIPTNPGAMLGQPVAAMASFAQAAKEQKAAMDAKRAKADAEKAKLQEPGQIAPTPMQRSKS